MKQLIENYKLILKNIEELLNTSRNSGSANDIEKFARLKTKKFAYMTFISELERLEADENDRRAHSFYGGINPDIQKLIDITFEVAMTVSSDRLLRRLNNQNLAKWVSGQLKACGIETTPCGASWGVLKIN